MPTWSVAELHDAIAGLLDHVFGEELWIEGELRNLKRSQRGHVYFDLVDAGAPDDGNRPMLNVTLFDRERQAVNRHLLDQGGAVRMVDGVRVRIRGSLGTYAARSSLQLRMSWIDPAYTLGVIGLEREKVLATLAAEGLLEVNSRVPLAVPPLRVALVTSVGSAAHADALDELRRSGLGFRVTVLDARTQGIGAEQSLIAALRYAESLPVDVVALVRGGGARTDLAAFDSEPLARTITALRLPVVTGIGHEIDRTVADEVAHSSHKTPTACAASLVVASLDAAASLHDSWVRVSTAATGRVLRADQRLELTSRDAGRAALRHLDRDGQRVRNLVGRITVAAPRRPLAAATALDATASRVPNAAARQLGRSTEVLDSLAARARSHDPARALARGWSITRGPDGTVLRSTAGLRHGDRVETTVEDGTFTAAVERVDGSDQARGSR